MKKKKMPFERAAAIQAGTALLHPDLDGKHWLKGWLATSRRLLALTQGEVGQMMRTTSAAVSKIEKGERTRTVTLASIDRYAATLGCRLVYGLVPMDGRTPPEVFFK